MQIAEVIIDVPARARAEAERAAYAIGAQGVEVRDEETGGPRGRAQVVVWLPRSTSRAVIARVVRGHLSRPDEANVTVRRVEASWLPSPAPRPIGARFVVVSADDEDDPVAGARAKRIPLRVDGALGFGDGVHPTTALCVEALERLFVRVRPRSVLDVGTGTGILALVAAKLGARDVVATDVDPLARVAARESVRSNDARVRVQTALPRRTFDLVVANLYFEPLVAMAPRLARCVSERGRLLVSGFTREEPVRDAFAPAGLVVSASRSREGWRCLELTRAVATRRRRSPGTSTPAR